MARTKREEARARREALALRKELREVHEVKACDKRQFAVGRQIRDALLSLPDRLAGIVAAEQSQHEVHQILYKEIRQALIALKTDHGVHGTLNGEGSRR
jgi:hypothetical protein